MNRLYAIQSTMNISMAMTIGRASLSSSLQYLIVAMKSVITPPRMNPPPTHSLRGFLAGRSIPMVIATPASMIATQKMMLSFCCWCSWVML